MKSHNFKPFVEASEFTWHQCIHCGLIKWINPLNKFESDYFNGTIGGIKKLIIYTPCDEYLVKQVLDA